MCFFAVLSVGAARTFFLQGLRDDQNVSIVTAEWEALSWDREVFALALAGRRLRRHCLQFV